ncbi:hypothetical protein F2Q69_00029931 [Brassica cretica]|uniref:Uncharacterized protein n=1 Tax=Brassica cretica TaxID=69181 RepID=A0A8S9S6A5_BRACR|nr:hypothetical protein F2Q69_00029931 [Brassica cretica]
MHGSLHLLNVRRPLLLGLIFDQQSTTQLNLELSDYNLDSTDLSIYLESKSSALSLRTLARNKAKHNGLYDTVLHRLAHVIQHMYLDNLNRLL